MSRAQTGTADSIAEQDSNNGDKEKKVKTRKPANTAFRQQRLKAWQPILTPKTVLPLFFVVGIIFAPIGGLLLWASAQVQEVVIDYTHCQRDAPEGGDFGKMPDSLVSTSFSSSSFVKEPSFWKWTNTTVHYGPAGSDGVDVVTPLCSITVNIPELKPPILFYYRLTNFYQNHRRYVKSLDSDQLKGTAKSADSIGSGSCDPLRLDNHRKPYYPCGLIANSIFNDTFHSPILLNLQNDPAPNKTYQMANKGIAWPSDKKLYGPTKYKVSDIAVPPNWQARWPNGSYTEDYGPPNLEEDEAFQVWMRTAGLPSFSKLALRNDNESMTLGRYQFDVEMNFPADKYGGTKSIVITTRTVMGGKNPFLGIAYVVVGGICVLLGALFMATHLIKPRKLGDHTYLTWNNDAPTQATTTGRDTRGQPSGA